MHILQTERNVATFLNDAALALADDEGQDVAITSFRTAGVMSANEGFVLRVGPGGGPEFQITVIRSK